MKADGVQVGVFEREPQAHRFAGQLAHITAILPPHFVLGIVAEDLFAFAGGEARDGSSLSVLDLHADAALLLFYASPVNVVDKIVDLHQRLNVEFS